MGSYTLHRKSVGHLGRQERPKSGLKGKGLSTGREYNEVCWGRDAGGSHSENLRLNVRNTEL